ncbi:MAG: hypothetical protein RSB70_01595 [Clostridium sp.]
MAPSINNACSLCYLKNAIAIEVSLEKYIIALQNGLDQIKEEDTLVNNIENVVGQLEKNPKVRIVTPNNFIKLIKENIKHSLKASKFIKENPNH